MRHNETRNVTILSRIVNRIILFFYWLKGWQVVEHFPQDVKKCVDAGAQRASNRDLVVFAGATQEEQVQPVS